MSEESTAAQPQEKLPEGQGAAPEWAVIPEGLNPPAGRLMFFFRFPAKWTDTPSMGTPLRVDDEAALRIAGPGGLWRQCIMWSNSLGDQRLASNRAMGDNTRYGSELTKQAIRAVDGHLADNTGLPTPGNVDLWWERIGERCRRELLVQATRMHSLTQDERAFFFEHCVAIASVG